MRGKNIGQCQCETKWRKCKLIKCGKYTKRKKNNQTPLQHAWKIWTRCNIYPHPHRVWWKSMSTQWVRIFNNENIYRTMCHSMRNIIYFFTKLFWCHYALLSRCCYYLQWKAVTVVVVISVNFLPDPSTSIVVSRTWMNRGWLEKSPSQLLRYYVHVIWICICWILCTVHTFRYFLLLRSLKRKYISYAIAFDDGIRVIYTSITLTSTQEISFNCFLVLQKRAKQKELSTRCKTTVIFYFNSLWVGNKNYECAFSLQWLKVMNSFESINGKATRKEWCGF